MECNNTAGYVRKRWIALTITPAPRAWSSSWHAREIVLIGLSATDFLKIEIRYACKRYGIREETLIYYWSAEIQGAGKSMLI